MPKIAVLGANGQVGAELCLLLRGTPGVELVPVCRNPTGSAFLRYSGIACRHGRPADPAEAPGLMSDCNVIVNCTLSAGTPGEIRKFDRALIRNAFEYSAPGATVIHCSTVMVHGDPRPGLLWRHRDAYGRAKRAAERRLVVESRRTNKPGFALRLGHVCGSLQNITHKIRGELLDGRAVLYQDDVPSNTVYTATIVDAIMAIAAGREEPGIYDLTNVPQWSWRRIYEFERRACGAQSEPLLVAGPARKSSPGIAVVRDAVRRFLRSPFVRRSLDGWLALAPADLNARAQAIWFRLRARAEIAGFHAQPQPAPEMSWIPLDRRTLKSLRMTEELVPTALDGSPGSAREGRWAADLVPATSVRPAIALSSGAPFAHTRT